MINRLLDAVRALRVRHHIRCANAAATATLGAQQRRDFPGASRHFKRYMAHAAKRDELRQGSCPPCNHNCRQGRDCPART